ncbi:MAG: hypothetical protein HYS13_06035 [Planctomycetia bacterium]|nr:hypothetical protein [Planctomycetia bacterium]
MWFRRTALGTAVAAIVGGSFWMSSDEQPRADGAAAAVTSTAAAATGGQTRAAATSGTATTSIPSTAAAGGAGSAATLVGPTLNVAELFRFDITKDWILARWAYVSTLTGQTDLVGYRVPVVTGTRGEDVAGSLTYYFDAQDKLQRITFHGTSAEPRPLIFLLVQQYGFQRKESPQPGAYLYQVPWDGKVHSEFSVRPARVLTAAAPHARYEVQVTLGRPPGEDRPLGKPTTAGPAIRL